jgi:hypothetical protein
MEEQLLNTEENTLTFHQLGFKAAHKSSSHLSALEGLLATAYNYFLRKQELDEEGIQLRITQLKSEIEQETGKKNDLSSEITIQRERITTNNKRTEELELEKIDLRKGENDDEASSEVPPFIIASFITLLLTLYLFLFYSSTGFSVFYGIEENVSGFINSDVFSMAKDKGNGALIFVILFPVIFLAVGFVLHSTIEKNKFRRKRDKRPQYFGIILILMITLVADAIIGYKISEGIHNNAFNMGLTKDVWLFEMIYTDINFYLVLILGFVVYVIWGILLNYILSHPFLKSSSERTKLLIENLNERIRILKDELPELTKRVHKLESDRETVLSKITSKRNHIIGYEGNVIPVDTSLLNASVGEFMGGYQTYTTNSQGNTKKTKAIVQKALEIQEKWLTNKIDSLETMS